MAGSLCYVVDERVEAAFLNDPKSLVTTADTGENHFRSRHACEEYHGMPCEEDHSRDKSYSLHLRCSLVWSLHLLQEALNSIN
jgi:hypothetical protein